MSDEFDRSVEQLGTVAGQPGLVRLPIIVIGAGIVRGQPSVSRVRPGSETEIAWEAILPARSGRYRKRTGLAEEQPLHRLGWWRLLCFAPGLFVHREIMDLQFP